jgi:dolichyl-phosphate beta-glucosyltransferase
MARCRLPSRARIEDHQRGDRFLLQSTTRRAPREVILNAMPEVALSIVIPAYNEARRLPPFLDTVRSFLAGPEGGRSEVLVVDDGSRDGTAEFLRTAAAEFPQLVVLTHPENRGKGAAVRTGMLAARGRLVLFADADGATPIDQLPKLAAVLEAGADVAIGSRLVAGSGETRRRHWLRAWAGAAFARLARRLLHVSVQDTQCGFKMFRRETVPAIFGPVQETGYLFDLEVLALAGRLGYRVAEVPVEWTEQPGGALHLVRDGSKMFWGLWRLRRRLQTASPAARA